MTSILKKRIIFKLVLLLMLISSSNVADGSTLEVGDGKKYSSIQAAVDAASCGDTIIIYKGTYSNVLIDNINPGVCNSSNPLQLSSAESGVVIDANSTDTCLWIRDTAYIEWDNSENNRITLQECGKPYDDPDQSYTSGHGIFISNTSDYIIKGFNIMSSGSSPDKFPHIGGDEEDQSYINTYGFGVAQNRMNTTRPDWSQITDINIDCDNCFSWGFLIWFANKVKIHNVKMLRAGSKYGCYLKGNEDILFEKNYCWYSENVKSYNDNASPWHAAVRGGSLRLRDSERVIVRYNIFDSTGSAGQMFGILVNDQGSAGPGFDGAYRQNEQIEFYNNTQICDQSPQSNKTIACFSFSGEISNSKFYNNILHTLGSEVVIDKRYCGDISSYDLHNFLLGNSTTESTYECDQTKFIWHNKIVGNPLFNLSGSKPSPYFKPNSSSSPSVDEGANVMNYTGTDYEGNKVPFGDVVDIGPFEYTPSGHYTDNVPPEPPRLISLE